jgi:glycosyltransferase involved in cell wall biosynthesis
LSASGDIDVSVIVPAYRAAATLGRCVESLTAQRFSGRFEIVVVASADHRSELPVLASHPALTCIAEVPQLPAAVARNRGARVARGRALAFTDADVLTPEHWLQQLCDASEQTFAVAGSVANGTPASVAGTVQYLVEFFDLSPSRPEPSEHGATCNLLLPQAVWKDYGPFPETMDGCEDSWLTGRLLAGGHLRFAPGACVYHLNRRRFRAVLRHQYALGGSHARLALWQGGPLPMPVRDGARATAMRICHFYRTLRRWRAPQRRRALALAPLVAAGFCAWGAGLVIESRRLRRAGIRCPPE